MYFYKKNQRGIKSFPFLIFRNLIRLHNGIHIWLFWYVLNIHIWWLFYRYVLYIYPTYSFNCGICIMCIWHYFLFFSGKLRNWIQISNLFNRTIGKLDWFCLIDILRLIWLLLLFYWCNIEREIGSGMDL